MADGALPFSYEVAWGAAMGGGGLANGSIGPDGSFRLVRGPGRGGGAGGGVERIFDGNGGIHMFSRANRGVGGSAAGIASMLFGDMGPPGVPRAGTLGAGGVNRLTMRFTGLPLGDAAGGHAQQFVHVRGVDPRGQERPITTSLLSRMLGMAGPAGADSGLELLEARSPLHVQTLVLIPTHSCLFTARRVNFHAQLHY
jgi:hypothetical protein